ncbi:hypothetical protein ACKGJO_05290 [Gracilimonas sp. Q87]|uniref:hypothetical protein n=1 Tax=Gracilimonas sp. Q87 TaxID=3384766 RepID=UPI0039845476
MEKIMSYEITCIKKTVDKVSGEICGGDPADTFTRNRKDYAIKLAKKLSMNDKWHEVMVLKSTRDDPEYQAYFSDGKLKVRMF